MLRSFRVALVVAALVFGSATSSLADSGPSCAADEHASAQSSGANLIQSASSACTKNAPTTAAQTESSDAGSDRCDYYTFDATKAIRQEALSIDDPATDAAIAPPPGEDILAGQWVYAICDSGNNSRQWVRNGQPPLANPLDLALQARSSVTVTTPAMSISPDWTLKDGRKATLKKAQTWFWASDKGTWSVLTPRVDAGPVWAQATITPTALVINPNDGVTSTLTCGGPGTPIPASTPMTTQSPDCSLAFLQQTDGGTWPVSVSVRYSVTWSGFDGTQTVGGTLDPLVSAPVVYPLAVITARTQLIDPNGPRS